MPEYKDVTELKKQIADFKRSVSSTNSDYLTGYICALSVTEGMIAGLPAVDVVSQAVFEQVKWERDTALATLKEQGIGLAEKADVVEIVRGEWIKRGMITRCSVCDKRALHNNHQDLMLSNYCPYCGADMRGDKNG